MPPEKRPAYQNHAPIYDTSLKELIEQQAAAILPHFVDGATYAETLTIEVVRPTMRADRVYKIVYRDEPHILQLEFQISGDADLPARLLVY